MPLYLGKTVGQARETKPNSHVALSLLNPKVIFGYHKSENIGRQNIRQVNKYVSLTFSLEIKVTIKNRHELVDTVLREQAITIIEAGIDRVMPKNLMKAAVNYDPSCKSLLVEDSEYRFKGRVFVIGGGKAADDMAAALEDLLGPHNISAGIVNCNASKHRLGSIKVIKASHPIPDKRGFNGVKQMLAFKNKFAMTEDDLIICLLSGGGSALIPYPVSEISLQDKQSITNLLLRCGAEIHEINAIRKHISGIKGGRLGEFFSPVKVVSLIISDVVGDDLDVIASGPTYPDSTTFQDTFKVLNKYNLIKKAPKNIVNYLSKGCAGKEVEETPKVLTNCYNHIIGNNELALGAMSAKAKEFGFHPYIITSQQKGGTTDVAISRAREIIQGSYSDHDAIIIGGETTPTLPESAGKGGRNQHYVAVSMLAMEPAPENWIVASVATDGSDYLPDVAGAIVDNNTLSRTVDKQINVKLYIDRFDSNTLLKKIGGTTITTGDTGTNVGDVILYLFMRNKYIL